MITELERRLIDAFHEDAQRARLVHPDASWDDREGRSHLQLGDTRLEPDEQLVPAEIYVSVDSPPTSETRNRRRLAIAAAAVVAVIGVAAIATNSPNSDDDVEPAPAVQPTVASTTVAPTTIAPRTETGFLDGADGLSVTFTVPDGWNIGQHTGLNDPGNSAPLYAYHHNPPDRRGPDPVVRFIEVGNVYADGCQAVLVDPPVGPTVDDLVSALANLLGLAPTAAADITIDGYVGKQIEFNVPRYADECKDSAFALWKEIDDKYGFSYWAKSNNHIRLWILDVGATRLVIEAYSYESSTSPQDRVAIDEIVASIQIG